MNLDLRNCDLRKIVPTTKIFYNVWNKKESWSKKESWLKKDFVWPKFGHEIEIAMYYY